ncbi:MAG: carbohydrate binding family 9 domain-containing protein [Acidobacteriota bacterium]
MDVLFMLSLFWAESASIHAPLTPVAPKIDGQIDATEWAAAARIPNLRQQLPNPGADHPFRTTVLVMADAGHLYFGFICHDPDPKRIAMHTMRADDDFSGDDSVALVLDTFGDARTGYLFRINAAGARQDGLIANLVDEPSLDWTGLWDARTGRFPGGWMAEIVIPSRTLNFTRGLPHWGLNFERHIARDRLFLNWANTRRDAFFVDLSRAGRLTGLDFVKAGRGLELIPYALGRRLENFGKGPAAQQSTVGLDANYRLSPDLNLSVTANTDFAETEVDLRQNNTTRFPLFFPERRAFFLEGSNQFEFGLGLATLFQPFFTRRVGLVDGRPAPIDYGVRLLGRSGRVNVGAMHVETRPIPGRDRTQLSAGRLSYDLKPEVRLGAIFTNGSPDGSANNPLGGVDAVWRTSQFRQNRNLAIGGWALRSGGNGYGVTVDYPNDRFWSRTQIHHFGPGLDAAIGFLPRPGVTSYRSENWFQPRPGAQSRWRFVRQAFYGYQARAVVNARGQTETWGVELSPLSWEFQTGDMIEFSIHPQQEFLPVPFEIAPGLTIPTGRYPFRRWKASALSSRFRRWRASGEFVNGGFYSGQLLETTAALDFNAPDGRWQIQFSQNQNFGRLAEGNFLQRLWLSRLVLSPTPYFSLTSLIQYDSAGSNVGGNTRLQWMIRPGRELIFVWNRGWRQLRRSREDLTLLPESEALILKMRWTFRY